jgi:hypothetical protein
MKVLYKFFSLEKNLVIDEFDNEVHCVEINIEEDPEIAKDVGIMGTPCIQFFKNKEKLKQVKEKMVFEIIYILRLSWICCYKIIHNFRKFLL